MMPTKPTTVFAAGLELAMHTEGSSVKDGKDVLTAGQSHAACDARFNTVVMHSP